MYSDRQQHIRVKQKQEIKINTGKPFFPGVPAAPYEKFNKKS